ncbi:MAG: hypothetical protein U0704_10105 [Candidatus Eisenbacteria bacterium]
MPYALYKLMHLAGIFTLLVSYALACAHARGGDSTPRSRRGYAITHGVAALFVLTGGFGMLARLGTVHGALPGWILIKLALWTLVAGAIALPHRNPRWARALPVVVTLLALAAAATAIYKPFHG